MDAGSLTITDLTKRYSGVKVVSDVSVTIPSGQFFSLLGPSGSGKTTTLMMIAGFTERDGGSIAFAGRDIAHLAPQHRGLGMVFQNYALFPHLSIAENVAFPLRVRGKSAAEVNKLVGWALDVVRLTGFEKRLPRELSGGQQQRVALARAVVYQPPVVLMDEPLGALDKNLRYQMQVEIKEIQQRLGMTVIYVTHDQEEAMNMSDVIAIMNHGRIEQMGAPTEVYEQPNSIFAGKFLGEANLIEGEVQASGGDRILRRGGTPLRAARSVSDTGITRGGKHFIRPEKITVMPGGVTAPDERSNALGGKVSRVSFLGHLVRYGVDIGGGELVTADAHNDGTHAMLNVGDDVTTTWAVRDSVLYHHGDPASLVPARTARTTLANLDPAWLAVPMALLLAVMFVAPILWFFVRTLAETGDGLADILDTIWSVLTSEAIRGTIFMTNWIALIVTLTALFLSYPIAYMMTRAKGLGFTLLIMCVILPYFTSVIVRTYSWMVILGRQGLINSLLLWLGIIDEPLSMMYNTFAVVVGMVYVLLPYLVLTLYAVMKGIDPSLMRAARGLGAGGFYIFRRIYLPLTLHGVFSGCLIVFILAIGFFITPALMGGPGDVMIAMLIEREVELTLNWPLAAIMSLFLLAVTLVLYAIYYRFANIERMMG